MRWKFEGGKKMRGKGRTYWAEVRERRGGGEAGREEGVRQRLLWLLRQSAGSRQSADRVYSLAAVVSPGGSLARVLPSLPLVLLFLLQQPNTHTYSHSLAFGRSLCGMCVI